MMKKIKGFLYTFIISIVGIILMSSIFKNKIWAKPLLIVFITIAGLIAIMYMIILLYVNIDNKKIEKLLNTDDYHKLIKYCSKHKFINSLMEERKTYYDYLLLLSYFALNDVGKINEYNEKFVDKVDLYPMILYWNAGFEFCMEKYDKIKEYADKFINSFEVSVNKEKYDNLISILQIYILFIDDNIKEAKEKLNEINMENITMPSTLKALDIIKNS